MKKFMTLFVFSLISLCTIAQTDVLTNETIIELHKGGMGEAVLLGMIETSETNFDVSTTAIVELGKAGVPDAVIKAMMDANKRDELLNADPNDPNAPHNPGLYYYDEVNQKMYSIEATIPSGTKFKHNPVPMGKSKDVAQISGENAQLQIAENQPVFYFYFNQDVSNPGNYQLNGASSPAEFVLLEMDQKSDEREIVTGKFGSYNSQSGVEDAIEKNFDKIEVGVYKVTPEEPLDEGEFCFYLLTGTENAPVLNIYDFGILDSEDEKKN